MPVGGRHLDLFQQTIESIITQSILPLNLILCADTKYVSLQKNGPKRLIEFNDYIGGLQTNIEITWIDNNYRKGASTTRNHCISELEYLDTYTCLADDDDPWKIDKVENQFKVMHNQMGILGTQFEEIETKTGKIIQKSSRPNTKEEILRVINNGWSTPFAVPGVMLHTKRLIDSGGFKENLLSGEDLEYYLRFIRNNPELDYQNINEVGFTYNTYQGNTSTKRWFEQRYQAISIFANHYQLTGNYKALLTATPQHFLRMGVTPKIRRFIHQFRCS